MREELRNHDLEQKLIPSFSVGCRRLTPGMGYLKVRLRIIIFKAERA